MAAAGSRDSILAEWVENLPDKSKIISDIVFFTTCGPRDGISTKVELASAPIPSGLPLQRGVGERPICSWMHTTHITCTPHTTLHAHHTPVVQLTYLLAIAKMTL